MRADYLSTVTRSGETSHGCACGVLVIAALRHTECPLRAAHVRRIVST
jgi:hypothetical protein